MDVVGLIPRLFLLLPSIDFAVKILHKAVILRHPKLPPLAERRRKQIREEPLQKRENQHVPHGRQRHDHDNRKRNKHDDVLPGASQRANLTGGKRIARDRLANDFDGVGDVAAEELEAADVKQDAFLGFGDEGNGGALDAVEVEGGAGVEPELDADAGLQIADVGRELLELIILNGEDALRVDHRAENHDLFIHRPKLRNKKNLI
mmetsp:Transcript_8255/g.20575  ORF Transcript_8255/g.20575 Transcript_8255/m.20575 type:complete len:205 (+) Transcript_8255:351-965(+)